MDSDEEGEKKVASTAVSGLSWGSPATPQSSTGSTQSSSSSDSDSEIDMGCASGRQVDDGQQQYGAAQVDVRAARHSARRRQVTFDKAMPARHRYLGGDLEDLVAERTVYEPGEQLDNVPLFPVPHVVLMPGRTLPLTSLHPRAVSMFRGIIDRKTMFAVVSIRFDAESSPSGPLGATALAPVGTLAQVLSFKENNEHEISTLKLLAVGRQRFTLLHTTRLIDGSLVGRVRIRPDVRLGFPLRCAESPSMARLRVGTKHGNWRRKYAAAQVTAWPAAVYRLNDVEYIMSRIVAALRDWYDEEQLRLMAENTEDFSFWLASCMPIDDTAKLGLLQVDCTLRRLCTELKLLESASAYNCAGCNSLVTMRSDIFSMSVDGPMAAYVNPGGHVHEMLTVYRARNVRNQGGPSRENSWFPGYAWTIITCSTCDSHLGWMFTAALMKANLRPIKFYGLTRAALKPSMVNVEQLISAATGQPVRRPAASSGSDQDLDVPVRRGVWDCPQSTHVQAGNIASDIIVNSLGRNSSHSHYATVSNDGSNASSCASESAAGGSKCDKGRDDDSLCLEGFHNLPSLVTDLRRLAAVPHLCDVVFIVGKDKVPVLGVRAILAVRSRVFYKLLCGPRSAAARASHTNHYQNLANAGITQAIYQNVKSAQHDSYSNFDWDFQPGGMQSPGSNGFSSSRSSEIDTKSKTAMPNFAKLQRILTANGQAQRSGGQDKKSAASIISPEALEALCTNKSIVTVEEFEPPVFQQLLEFAHTGLTTFQPETIIGLMNAADHFAMDDLRKSAQECAYEMICTETACLLLATGERYVHYKATKSFMQRLLSFIDSHGDSVLDRDEFALLSPNVLELVLSRPHLNAAELTKYRTVMRWAQHAIHTKRLQGPASKILARFIHHIGFHEIPASVLMTEIRPMRIVPDTLMMQALAYQADPSSVDTSIFSAFTSRVSTHFQNGRNTASLNSAKSVPYTDRPHFDPNDLPLASSPQCDRANSVATTEPTQPSDYLSASMLTAQSQSLSTAPSSQNSTSDEFDVGTSSHTMHNKNIHPATRNTEDIERNLDKAFYKFASAARSEVQLNSAGGSRPPPPLVCNLTSRAVHQNRISQTPKPSSRAARASHPSNDENAKLAAAAAAPRRSKSQHNQPQRLRRNIDLARVQDHSFIFDACSKFEGSSSAATSPSEGCTVIQTAERLERVLGAGGARGPPLRR